MNKETNKLCLGTVQLGLKYGIRNSRKDKLKTNASIELLRKAYSKGICFFDTASSYGNAEQLIGCSGISKESDAKIVTKVKTNSDISMADELKDSMSKLAVKKIDGVLLHEPSDYYDKSVLADLKGLKESGLVNNIGVSIYEPDDAVHIVTEGIIDYIQVPYNVFDQRLDYTDFFSITKVKNIKVFARSVFLQGLLLFDVNELPEKFMGIKEYVKRFNDTVSEYGFTNREAAFLFSLCKPEIDKVVFGVDDSEQLMNNIEILKRRGEFEECNKCLKGIAKDIDTIYLNPSRWNEL